MKLFYFFLISSCMFVNISAEEDASRANYMRAVVLTNETIKNAGPKQLERAIESLAGEDDVLPNFVKLNYGIAVPDAKPVEDIDVLTERQIAVGDRIRKILGMGPTTIDENQNFGSFDLDDLGKERRDHTGPALRSIIERHLAEPVQHTLDSNRLKTICRLLGFYTSTQFPINYIKTVRVNLSDATCILWDGEKNRIYRRNGRAWVQLTAADIRKLSRL